MEEKTFTDISTSESFPKTLMVRNHEGGLIWQVYHVQKQSEADKIAYNAYRNGFFGSTLENYQPDYEETWPDWRETPGGLEIIS
jgi:2-succinyl-5-enolpyruvyl-6-hydroxy-3-cyclohexene-1-carboxylate synthase